MKRQAIIIPTMQGGRATTTVIRLLDELPRVEHRDVDPRQRTMQLTWQAPTTWPQIVEHLSRAGFAPGKALRDPHGQQPQPVYESPGRG